jgi:hypothetical protein
MATRDIIDFSSYCGQFSAGAHCAARTPAGALHMIYGSGDSPRAYTLNGQPIEWAELQIKMRGASMGRFEQGAVA